MQLLTASQIRAWDAFTIKNEPITSHDLMERASRAFVKWYLNQFTKSQPVSVFCGMGNNGGDGLVIARLLRMEGHSVNVYAVGNPEKASPDFTLNVRRWENYDSIYFINDREKIPTLKKNEIVIDALFGSGLSRPIEGVAAEVIKAINQSLAIRVAVDIASGLFCDQSSSGDAIVKADYTVSFQVPKQAFFFPENQSYTGQWHVVDIGLLPGFLAQIETSNFVIDKTKARNLLRKRNPFGHKGTYGHTLIAGGHYGTIGAVILTAMGALRAGAGLVSTLVPRCGYSILQSSVPEAMCMTGDHENYLAAMVPPLEKYSAIALGPGLGTEEATSFWLETLLKKSEVPLVVDADALNLIAKKPELLKLLPAGSIITPHPGEFRRLAGESKNDFERWEKAKKLSQQHQIIVVLKGQHTLVTTPEGNSYFNTTGNPGMATGGSGDTLTGIIASLVAQGYTSVEAAMLGVYLHGKAGDLAAQTSSPEAVIASDLSAFLGKAFATLS